MDLPVVLLAGVVGLGVGSLLNRRILGVPGYVIRDPADLPEGADPALLDELEDPPETVDAPVLAILRPGRAHPRWLPIIELLTGVAYALTAWRFDAAAIALPVGFLLTALITLGAVDARVYRLPDEINLPAVVIGFLLIVLGSLELDVPGAIGGALIGAVGYTLVLGIFHVISPRGLAFGDVKLATLIGLYLGWLGWGSGPIGTQIVESMNLVIYAAFAGCTLGVVVGLVYGAVRGSLRSVVPFGPSLAVAGGLIALWAFDLG